MNIKLKYLCLAPRKPPDRAHLWTAAGRKKLTHPFLSLTRTRTYPPPLLVPKKPEFSLREGGSLGHESSLFLVWHFLNKTSIPGQHNSSLSWLSCYAVSRTSLDLVTGGQQHVLNPLATRCLWCCPGWLLAASWKDLQDEAVWISLFLSVSGIVLSLPSSYP